MRKLQVAVAAVFVLFSGSFAFGDSEAIRLVQSDVSSLKEKVDRVDFVSKQVANQVIELKNAIKEINTQLAKQNEINQTLVLQITELQNRVSVLEETLKQSQKIEKDTAQTKDFTGYINANGVGLRSKPTYRVKPDIWLGKGFKVVILDSYGSFYKVKLNDSEYFVSKKYVEVEK